MHELQVDRIRTEAGRKGMVLMPVASGGQADKQQPLYKLTALDQTARIFPQGQGVEGAPLHEIEEWLSWPWD